MASPCERIDGADAFVIAPPVNYYNVTAVTRRFMERLVCYGFWQWGQKGPQYRIEKLRKKAVRNRGRPSPRGYLKGLANLR